MDSEPANENEEELTRAEQFFGNLLKKGFPCPIINVRITENPFISGKITCIGTPVKKSETQVRSCLVFTLKEMYAIDTERCIVLLKFIGEDVEEILKRDLRNGNYISICNPILFKNHNIGNDPNQQRICIVVDSRKYNATRDVYYKRRYGDSWICLTNPIRQRQASLSSDGLCDPGEIVYTIDPDAMNRRILQRRSSPFNRLENERANQSAAIQENEGSPHEVQHKHRLGEQSTPSIDDNVFAGPSTSGAWQSTRSPEETSTRRDEDMLIRPASKAIPSIFTDATRSDREKKRVTFDQAFLKVSPSSNRSSPVARQADAGWAQRSDFSITRNFLNNDTRMNKTRSLNSEYAKLADVRKDMKVNLFGIVMRILKGPSVTADEKYHMAVAIADQTFYTEFKVHINFFKNEATPTIRQYDILRFSCMRIVKAGDKLVGRISSSNNVVAFSRENPEFFVTHQNKKCDVSEEDKRRIHELREWMFTNIPNARVFTPLSGLESRNEKVNFSCQPMERKMLQKLNEKLIFEKSTFRKKGDNISGCNTGIVTKKIFTNGVVVLRVRDISKCRKPVVRYPLEKYNDWVRVLAEAVTVYDSDDIDICIASPEPNLLKKIKILKTGDNVELFNVNIGLYPEVYKTVKRFAIKAFMPANSENLKIVNEIEENNTSLSDKLIDEQLPHDSSDTDDDSQNDSNRRYGLKRKLFNPNEIEDDGSNLKQPQTEKEKQPGTKANAVINSDCVPVKPKLRKPNSANKTTETAANESRYLEVRIPHIENYKQYLERTITDIPRRGRNLSCDVPETLEDSVRREEPTIQPFPINDIRNSTLNGCASPVISPGNSQTSRIETRGNSLTEILYHEKMAALNATGSAKSNDTTEIETDSLNYRIKWPSPDFVDEFYIRVYLASTDPDINVNTPRSDTIALIRGYCNDCHGLYSFLRCEWIESSNKNRICICPKCKADKNVFERVDFILACDLLLQDDEGALMPAAVRGRHAEKFFGCTAKELASSVAIENKVRHFIDAHLIRREQSKRALILKVKRDTSTDFTQRYFVLS